jgi:para-nitrobenzyl esterase
MMKKAFLISIVLLTGILGYLFLFTDASPEPRTPDPVSLRHTTLGNIVGYRDKYHTHGWLGIRYGASTGGHNRWRAPQPATHREGTFEALDVGNICPQAWGPGAGIEGEQGDIAGDEDCLFLNVWAPVMDPVVAAGKKLPVMVWFHGGANAVGTANTYPGYQLAGQQQVVFLAVNSRLNTLGWFSHPALTTTATSAADASGNYGTLDLIHALQWVQDNISAFGGNPDNVTIFGESAGGHNVYAMLASPLAKGLFHKAIVQSGMASSDPIFRAHNYIDDDETGQENSSAEILLRLLIQDGLAADRASARKRAAHMSPSEITAYLRGQSLEALYGVFEIEPGGFFQVPHHIRDGYVIPTTPFLELFGNPERYNAVPVILGTNRDEGKLATLIDPEYVEWKFGFFPVIQDRENHQRMSAYISDAWKALSVDEPAAVLFQSQGDTVYSYRFEWDDWPYQWFSWLVDLNQLLGAVHALDLSFVFGDVDGVAGMEILRSDANKSGRLALQRAMMNYWGNFAWTGAPGNGRDGQQPLWTPWQPEGDSLMILDDPSQGGLRMSPLRITARTLKQRLINDPVITDQERRCRLYAQLFLASHQIDDFFSATEYATLGETGCHQYDPWQFYSRNL